MSFENSSVTGTAPLTVPSSETVWLEDATLSVNIVDDGSFGWWEGSTIVGNLAVSSSALLQEGFPSDYVFPSPGDAPANSAVLALTVTGNVANDGTVDLYNTCSGDTLTVNGTLTNNSDGTIQALAGFGSTGAANVVNANIDNQGTINVSGANLAINQGTGASAYTLTNEANSTINVGTGQTLTVGGASVANNGAIEIGATATADFSVPTVTINGKGTLQGAATSTLEIGGSLLGNTTSVAAFSEPGTVILDGNGTASSPQLLELMEPDQGDVAAGYTSSLAYGTLQVGAGTYVKLVNQFQNSPSNGKAEAGYANLFIVPTGSTFDRGGLNFYAKSSEIKTSQGVFSGGYWYLNVNGKTQIVGVPANWSAATPVTGDWNGDGKDKIGLFLNGTWWLDTTGDGVFRSSETFTFGFGGSDVVPVVGDWNGAGKTEVGVYANGAWFRDVDGTHTWDAANQATLAYLGWNDGGTHTVIPVPGEWAGDGKTEMGVYCQGVWFLDSTGSNKWDGNHTYWGWSGSLIPVVGNWSGKSTKSQLGVYNQGAWFLDYDNSHAWDTANQAALAYCGWSGALPVVGNWGGGIQAAAGSAGSIAQSPTPRTSQLQPQAFVSIPARTQLQSLDPRAVDRVNLSSV